MLGNDYDNPYYPMNANTAYWLLIEFALEGKTLGVIRA